MRQPETVSRAPQHASSRPKISSRGWNRYQKFVSAPRSTRFVPMQTKWSVMRENSERISARPHRARGGASMPSIFSTAMQ